MEVSTVKAFGVVMLAAVLAAIIMHFARPATQAVKGIVAG